MSTFPQNPEWKPLIDQWQCNIDRWCRSRWLCLESIARGDWSSRLRNATVPQCHSPRTPRCLLTTGCYLLIPGVKKVRPPLFNSLTMEINYYIQGLSVWWKKSFLCMQIFTPSPKGVSLGVSRHFQIATPNLWCIVLKALMIEENFCKLEYVGLIKIYGSSKFAIFETHYFCKQWRTEFFHVKKVGN
jgi:hypothetical protein